jgi:hypothetical protein
MGRSSVITIEPNNGMPFSTFNVLKEYLQIRPVFDGPLYCYLNRTSLTRKQFVHVLHASLKYMGYTTEKFMGYTTDKFMGYTTDKILLICGSDTFIIVCTSEEFEQVNSPTLSRAENAK